MKKRFLSLFALCLICLLGVTSSAWGGDQVAYTLTPAAGTNNSYASNCDVTISDIKWNVTGNATLIPWRLGGKKVTATNRSIYSKTGISDNITKIIVTHGDNGDITVNSFKLDVYSTAALAEVGNDGDVSSLTGSYVKSGTCTFTRPDGINWAGRYYRFTYNVTNTTNSNKYCEFSKAVFYKFVEDGKTATTTSFSSNSYTAYIGEAFSSPLASVTASDSPVAGASVTYSSENNNVATVNASTGAVNIVGSGTTKITASYAGNDTYEASNATYTLTVGKVYASLATLVADGAPTTTGSPVKVTLTDEVILDFYTDKSSNKNGVKIKSGTQEVEIFCYNVPDTWEVNGTISGTLTCPWKLYNSTWELCPTSWDDLSYKAGTKTNPTITATYKTNMTTTDDDDVYTVETETDGAMTVTSSKTSVALAEWSGKTVTINPIAVGTTTIKISFSATDTYNAAEKEYTLTVTEPYSKDDYCAIVSKYDGTYYAMGTTVASGAANAVEVYSVNNKVITTSIDPESISWKKNSDNTVQNAAGEFVSFDKTTISLSNSSNKKFTEGSDEDGLYWYNDTRAFIYNDGTGFKTYAMSNVGNKGYGTLGYLMTFSDGYTRNVTEGNWGTICLPNAVEAADIYGAKFYSIAGKVMNGDNPTSLVLTEETGDLVAGRPYFFKATADTLIVAYTGAATKNPGDYNGLFGTFYGQDITVGYILSNNQLLEVNNTFTCGANRAYVGIASVPVYNPSSVKASIEIEIGGATGIESVGSSAIDTQSSTYSISGQKVDGSYKGIVIKNGKKYIIR